METTRRMAIHIDRFSSLDHLPKPAKTDDVLEVLRHTPKVSCFELSDRPDLERALAKLKAAGKIRTGGDMAFPWIAYEVVEP